MWQGGAHGFQISAISTSDCRRQAFGCIQHSLASWVRTTRWGYSKYLQGCSLNAYRLLVSHKLQASYHCGDWIGKEVLSGVQWMGIHCVISIIGRNFFWLPCCNPVSVRWIVKVQKYMQHLGGVDTKLYQAFPVISDAVLRVKSTSVYPLVTSKFYICTISLVGPGKLQG